jgi:hypothetical protein
MLKFIIDYGFDLINKDLIVEYLEMKKENSKKRLAPPSGLYLQNITYKENVFEYHKNYLEQLQMNNIKK